MENFIARREEIEKWRKMASREDIEYFECQADLNAELVHTYKRPERVFGKHLKTAELLIEFFQPLTPLKL